MSTSKHPKTAPGEAPRDDLEDNPGIGTSKGATAGGDPELIEGESTFEGDVENDTTPQGGVAPRHVGRTNKYGARRLWFATRFTGPPGWSRR